MTSQTIIENVLSVFPNVKEQQAVHDLDDAQKLFCTETGLLEERGQLSSISSNVAWSLPSNYTELTDVVLYDSNGNPKYLGDYNYAYEIEFNKFYIYSLNSTTITGLSTGIDSAYIHYKKTSTTITSRSTALEIDDQFTKALEHYLLADYFGKYPTEVSMMIRGEAVTRMMRDMKMADWHLKRYERLKIKAKRFVNKETGDGIVQNYQHAGAQVLPRRVNDGSLGSTTIPQIEALSQIYTKYVRFTLDSGDGDGAKTPSTAMIGYTDVVGTVSTNTFTIASTADFEKDTQILCNNSAVSWIYNSSSLITFSLPVGWGVVEIEIYER